MEEKWADLIKVCLINSKTSLTPYELNRDVKALTGKSIPYRQLNWNCLEEMLKSIRGLDVLQLDDITLVKHIADEQIHIQELMQHQKTKIRRKRPWRQPKRHHQQLLTKTPQAVLQQTSSSEENVQFASKPHLQKRLTSSERFLTALLDPVPDSVPPQQLSSVKSQSLTIELTSQGRHVISHPIDNPLFTLSNSREAKQLQKPVDKGSSNVRKNTCASFSDSSKSNSSHPQQVKIETYMEAALKELMKDKKSVVTSDRVLVTKRIEDIVNTYPSGLSESCVLDLYVKKYNENLPTDWLQLVENNADVRVNKCTILSSVNYNTYTKANPVTLLEPENINLSDFEEFWFHVYTVRSTTNICGVIIDENHSDKIDELSQEMKNYYNKEELFSSSISVIPGKYYAVFNSDWHRVRCSKFDEKTQNATVFFIDRGDEDVFTASKLRVLNSKFYRLPAQYVRISLSELEIFEDCQEAQALLEELLVDKNVYVRSTKNNERENRCTDMLLAELFFERNEEEFNANELIRNEILNTIANPLVFLESEKGAQEVYISSVSKDAIFVQLKSQGLRYLKTLINTLEKDLTSSVLRPVLRFDSTKMYIKNNHVDWLRVKIVKVEDESTAQVFCVDVGNTITVKRNNLVLLEDLSKILTVYPHQAVKVCLHNISPLMFNEEMANRLRDLALKTDVLLMKVMCSKENIPMVEFYKSTKNNCLASLNDILVMESEIKLNDDANSKSCLKNNQFLKDTDSEFPLKAPEIPFIGSFFVIHVTSADHPGNFKIQPFKNLYKLEAMMQELSEFYESYSGPLLNSSIIKIRNMYAAKEGGKWYRVYVCELLLQNNKSVCFAYFCDYGDYRIVSTNHLRPLENQFYDLPYQALTAKLYGVIPKLKAEWTLKDSYRFSELISTKNLVSIVKSYEIETMPTGGVILGLELIDTNNSEDIYIANVLVNENIANKVVC